jgi:hypothetical protein
MQRNHLGSATVTPLGGASAEVLPAAESPRTVQGEETLIFPDGPWCLLSARRVRWRVLPGSTVCFLVTRDLALIVFRVRRLANRATVPIAGVRNHGISTHGVHHTSSRVTAQYPVTIQETTASA